MAYQALYRKWRPATFDDVRGQDHIVTTLRNQVRTGRIGHAYLFCGTRGTGKTSVAKIFARAVNCEHPVDGNPCNCCAMCRAANENRSMNVIEIDAASNNGVDSVRQIRDEAAFSPAEGRYKVYIIDEAHMLTGAASNALLKTLEEPPSYVIFILATTEPNKLLMTILSRCQRYDFHRIPTAVISGRMRELVDAEGLSVEDAALDYVARAADGSMRDALSLLDQCISFYIGQTLTYQNTLDILGTVDMSVFSRMFACISTGDAGGTLTELAGVIAQGRDLPQLNADFIWYFRNLLMVKTAGDSAADIIDVSADHLQQLQEDARLADEATLMRCIRVLSELTESMRYASGKRVLMEVALIRLCRPETEAGSASLLPRIAQLERRLDRLEREGVSLAASAAADPGEKKEKKKPAPAPAPARAAVPEDIGRVIDQWDSLRGSLDGALGAALAGAVPSADAAGNLVVSTGEYFNYIYLSDEEHLKTLRQAAERITGAAVAIKTVFDQQEAAADYEEEAADRFRGIEGITFEESEEE